MWQMGAQLGLVIPTVLGITITILKARHKQTLVKRIGVSLKNKLKRGAQTLNTRETIPPRNVSGKRVPRDSERKQIRRNLVLLG